MTRPIPFSVFDGIRECHTGLPPVGQARPIQIGSRTFGITARTSDALERQKSDNEMLLLDDYSPKIRAFTSASIMTNIAQA